MDAAYFNSMIETFKTLERSQPLELETLLKYLLGLERTRFGYDAAPNPIEEFQPKNTIRLLSGLK